MTAKEIFDKKYEYYRNMENRSPIPIQAREMIFEAMESYASLKVAESMPTEEDIKKETDTFLADMVYEAGFVNGCEWFRNRMKGKYE